MNKPFFHTLAAIILLTAASGNAFCQAVMTMTTETNFREFEDKTIFEGDTLNGKIKTITQNTYGEYSKGKDVIYIFDEYGLQIRRKGIGQDIFYYYKFNKIIESSICRADNGKEYRKNEYLYDERGNLIKHIHIFLPNEKTITKYFYNNENKLIEERDSRKTIKYQYDANGDCVIEEEYGGKDVLTEKKEHKYINHKLVETFSWQRFEGEDLYIKDLYTYNENGTLKSNTHIIYHYGSKNHIAMENTTSYHYIYDDKNRLIEYKEINIGDYLDVTTTYENFDKKGNWQLKITYKDGKETKVTRKFEYYD